MNVRRNVHTKMLCVFQLYFYCMNLFATSLQIFNIVIFPISGKFLPIEEGDIVKIKKKILYTQFKAFFLHLIPIDPGTI